VNALSKLPWKWIGLAALLVAEVAVLVAIVISAQGGPANGLAVPANTAAIQVSDQRNVTHQLIIDHVLAPADGWIIVQADWGNGVPDAILGTKWVSMGESTGLRIKLDPQMPVPAHVFVTLLADMGKPDVLEYYVPMQPGMEKMRGMGSTVGTGGPTGDAAIIDLPVVAGGKVVMAHPSLQALSFAVGPSQAFIAETTRTAGSTVIVVPRVVAPAQSWVAASLVATSNQPAKLLGAALVQPGSSKDVTVALNASPGAQQVVVTLHVDLGTLGQFDYTPLQPGASLDQPYVAGGKTVSAPVRLVR
jgi:hypothetical protein